MLKPRGVGRRHRSSREEEGKQASPSYEKEPCEVMSRYGDQVVLRSPQQVQHKRNFQHIKVSERGKITILHNLRFPNGLKGLKTIFRLKKLRKKSYNAKNIFFFAYHLLN